MSTSLLEASGRASLCSVTGIADRGSEGSARSYAADRRDEQVAVRSGPDEYLVHGRDDIDAVLTGVVDAAKVRRNPPSANGCGDQHLVRQVHGSGQGLNALAWWLETSMG